MLGLVLAATATAVATQGGGKARPRADKICVSATISGLVSQTTGDFCEETPFVTVPLHREAGLQPYVWVVVDMRHP